MLFWGPCMKHPVILGPYKVLLILGNSHIDPASPNTYCTTMILLVWVYKVRQDSYQEEALKVHKTGPGTARVSCKTSRDHCGPQWAPGAMSQGQNSSGGDYSGIVWGPIEGLLSLVLDVLTMAHILRMKSVSRIPRQAMGKLLKRHRLGPRLRRVLLKACQRRIDGPV